MRSVLLLSLFMAVSLMSHHVDAKEGTGTMHEKPTVQQVISSFVGFKARLLDKNELEILFAKSVTRLTGNRLPVAKTDHILSHRGSQWRLSTDSGPLSQKNELGVNADIEVWAVKEGVYQEWLNGSIATIRMIEEANHNLYISNAYTRNLGINLNEHIAQTIGIDYLNDTSIFGSETDYPFLPESLVADQDHYMVREEKDDVDGTGCWVIERPGVDTIWISSLEPLRILKRHVERTPLGQRLDEVVKQSDFRAIENGLELPFRQDVVIKRPKSKLKVAVDVASFSFAATPSLLNFRPPSGTPVIDLVRGLRYRIVSGNEDPYERPISQVMPNSENNRDGGRFVRILYFNVFLVFLILCVYLWSRYY